jgi:hypothetical protein
MSAGMKSFSSEEGLVIKIKPKPHDIKIIKETITLQDKPRLFPKQTISYNYKPFTKVSGFDVEHRKDTRFPNPEPNTIIEYSVQGNLIRKRQCLAENDVVLSGTRGDVGSESVEHGLPPVEQESLSVDRRLPSENHRSLSTVDLSG